MIPMRERGILPILDHARIFSNMEIVMLSAIDMSRAMEARRRKSGINGMSGIGDIFLARVRPPPPLLPTIAISISSCF